MTPTELAEFITPKTVERAYRRANEMMVGRDERMSMAGWRAARARDPALLQALERGSTVLRNMSESQFGAAGLDVNGTKVPATEFQLWANAYTTADAGTPERNYQHIYGMAALLAGLWR